MRIRLGQNKNACCVDYGYMYVYVIVYMMSGILIHGPFLHSTKRRRCCLQVVGMQTVSFCKSAVVCTEEQLIVRNIFMIVPHFF